MIFSDDKKYILGVYNRLEIEVIKGRKEFLIDVNNKKYLDMASGIAVNSLGYHNRKINKAIKKQIKKNTHLSNYFVNKEVVSLGRLLIENTKMGKVFFANSGTEANEAAIKLVRKIGKEKDVNKTEIISIQDSFHGRTIGALSITGQTAKKAMFTPLLDKVIHINFNDAIDLKKQVSNNTCAIFIELIQGESGVNLLDKEFIHNIITIAKQYDFYIVIDEIQTGLMRTGSLFCYQQYDIKPDIITIAKSLGGGLPLGAMIVDSKLENTFNVGDHGSTFGGNPVCCAAGNACLKQLLDLKAEVNKKSKYILTKLFALKEKYPHVINDVRGMGLMIGIDVGKNASLIRKKAIEKGIILNITNQSIIRLLPPLNIRFKCLKMFINKFTQILTEIGVENEYQE